MRMSSRACSFGCSGGDDFQMAPFNADDRRGGNAPVEGCEHTSSSLRKREQVDVGNLPVRCRHGSLEQPRVPKRDVVIPEDMTAAGAERAETLDDPGRRLMNTAVGRSRKDANETVLRQRAGGPPAGAIGREPPVGGFVMDVVRIEQRHQNIDVQESNATQVSSRSRLTRAIVGRGLAFGRRGISGTPLRTRATRFGWSAFRARSERTRPADVRRLAAISLAASKTSPSISRVVLIGDIIKHHASDVNREPVPVSTGVIRNDCPYPSRTVPMFFALTARASRPW